MARLLKSQVGAVVALFVAFVFPACEADLAPKDGWGPLIALRDDTNTWPEGKPEGGWWVTPIHATLLQSGKVLVTGWGRRDRSNCTEGGFRKNGTTFLLDPEAMTSDSIRVEPFDEKGTPESDVLYCAGHGPLPNGEILYAGGSRYENQGKPEEKELGLNYARLYSPSEHSFSRVPISMAGGPPGKEGRRWYPTITRMADSRMLVTGGFTQYGQSTYGNRSIELFDYQKYMMGSTPWELLVSHDEGPSDIIPYLMDYTHVHLLPVPIPAMRANGIARQVAMIGETGSIHLFNYTDKLSDADRFMAPPNGHRGASGEGATGVLLPNGEVFVMGGTDDPSIGQRADFYNTYTDTWDSVDTGIGRYHPASVLLPDGTVLIVNGEAKQGFPGDPRQPQTIDPIARTVTTWPPWPDDIYSRGYHNFSLLLKDGRVLVGGGRELEHSGIKCERPDIRIYSPNYLFKGSRPKVLHGFEPMRMTIGGQKLTLDYTNGPLRAENGVILLAPGSMTHAFDQNQRYVPLDFNVPQSGRVQISPPTDYFKAPPGEYLLFLVNELGVPSEGTYVQVS